MGSPDGVEPVRLSDGVDLHVELNVTLFASFYILSIVLAIEGFDVSGHLDPIFSKPKEIHLLPHFEFVPLLSHFEFIPLLLHFENVVVSSNVVDPNDDVSLKS